MRAPATSAAARKVTGKEPHELMAGDIGRWERDGGNWYACTPCGRHVANLTAHTVTEHEDGTVSVSPSILITGHGPTWHGFLEHGVWREV